MLKASYLRSFTAVSDSIILDYIKNQALESKESSIKYGKQGIFVKWATFSLYNE